MEDKGLVSCSNQVENYRRDLQFSDSMNENSTHSKMKQYRRDFLLQLRLHPLSLQKPVNIPDIEVVKDKLYLHSIIDSSAKGDKYMDSSTYQTSLKAEYCNLKHDYPLLPHYFNRLYPYCFSPHMYNGPYQNSSSKFRSPFHTYCNPLKKHCVASHSCYKDFPDECAWAKRNYSSPEEIWSYPSHANTNFTKKKDSLEAVPKSRKKLSIIDPVTGKNVLEAITTISSEKQTETAQGNLESSQNYDTDMTDEKYAGDCFCIAGMSGEASLNLSGEDYQDSIQCSSEDKIYYEKIKDVDTMYPAEFFDKALEGDSSFDEAYENKTAIIDKANEDTSGINTMEELVTTPVDSSAANENVNKIKSNENRRDTPETNSLLNKQVPKKLQNKAETVPVDIHSNCQTHYRKDCNFYCKENVSKQSDMREGLKQLREKIYSLRQEQQKMAILQSFLRYKKYQLEESARNLDEKRIEIANWECTLYNKAKRLHDKELWLDNRSEILFSKAQQLAEKEKILYKEENKISNDCHNLKSDPKETQFSNKKFMFDNCVDTSWDEIPSKIKNIYGEENNEYNYFACSSNQSKMTEGSPSNVEKCKSDACSLDELERNIVLIEKMNSSNEGNTSLENKTELPSSNSLQKKDDSTACDPLGYSKGRRYLPEHIKYWLNKRDKSAL